MKRYAKEGEALPLIDITGQAKEKGSSRLGLGNGYVVILRNSLKPDERERLLKEIRLEIAEEEKANKRLVQKFERLDDDRS